MLGQCQWAATEWQWQPRGRAGGTLSHLMAASHRGWHGGNCSGSPGALRQAQLSGYRAARPCPGGLDPKSQTNRFEPQPIYVR